MRVLGVFAKYWSTGAVKTRLAATIGERPATDLYRQMLGLTLRRMRQAPADLHTIAYSPPESAEAFATLAPEWHRQPQAAGDLGLRLETFFHQHFAHGATKVAVIGSDCPDLHEGLVQQTWQLLDEVPVVWGPASDGGYYLLGLNRHVPQLFDGIQWSTDQVLTQSRKQNATAGLCDALLLELTDIDDWQSLQSWLAAHANTTDPALQALAAQAQMYPPPECPECPERP